MRVGSSLGHSLGRTMASERFAALLEKSAQSMQETAEVIKRMRASVRPLHRCTIQSRRLLEDSARLLQKVGTPWRGARRDVSSSD
jgi:hypothetical protein